LGWVEKKVSIFIASPRQEQNILESTAPRILGISDLFASSQRQGHNQMMKDSEFGMRKKITAQALKGKYKTPKMKMLQFRQ
jgi:hypothetical protein